LISSEMQDQIGKCESDHKSEVPWSMISLVLKQEKKKQFAL